MVVSVFPVEVGCRGFVAKSTIRLVRWESVDVAYGRPSRAAQKLRREVGTSYGLKGRIIHGLQGKKRLNTEGVDLWLQGSPLSRLETLWAYQRNIKERRCPHEVFIIILISINIFINIFSVLILV